MTVVGKSGRCFVPTNTYLSLAKSRIQPTCALPYFDKLLSFSHVLVFRRNFDRCLFDELSFDVISTNGRVRRDVVFDGKSHSTKEFSKSHGSVKFGHACMHWQILN